MEEQQKTKMTPTKRRRAAVILLAFVVFFGAVFAATALSNHVNKQKQLPAAKVAVVRITRHGFEPATLAVSAGTKVIWTNTDQALHQVASNPYPRNNGLPSLKSEILNNDQTYSYVANQTGSFGYHDQINPTVNGTLVVEKQ